MQEVQLNSAIIPRGLEWQVPSSITDLCQSKLLFPADAVVFDLLLFYAA